MTTISALASLAFASALSLAGLNTLAQEWPTKPVRLVVPMPPAGTTDNMGRLVAQKMSELIGQVVVVENKVGANGNIGSDFVSKAAPDGYTLLVSGVGSQGINATLYRSMPYDIVTGLTHIGMIAKGPNALVVNPAFAVNNLQELIALVKASPGKYNYASTGNGASNHLSMEMLKSAADLNITHIPYKGGAPAMLDLMSGQVPMMFINFDSAVPHVKSGKMRAIAVTSLTRRNALPDVPTVAESGFPGFEAESWTAISGPPNMPANLVARINEVLLRISKMPDVLEKFEALGLEASPLKPEAMKLFIVQEVEKWGKAVRASGAKVD
ncbi:MAG: tripartite tricarboxylate transporter substrate binding protein [Alcaligenaceae bacterium]|nr:tripartite tricarboxylate transporter substrate binding protein [Alcaligenaceae bacterium]